MKKRREPDSDDDTQSDNDEDGDGDEAEWSTSDDSALEEETEQQGRQKNHMFNQATFRGAPTPDAATAAQAKSKVDAKISEAYLRGRQEVTKDRPRPVTSVPRRVKEPGKKETIEEATSRTYQQGRAEAMSKASRQEELKVQQAANEAQASSREEPMSKLPAHKKLCEAYLQESRKYSQVGVKEI